jgi:hypothetical protein
MWFTLGRFLPSASPRSRLSRTHNVFVENKAKTGALGNKQCAFLHGIEREQRLV